MSGQVEEAKVQQQIIQLERIRKISITPRESTGVADAYTVTGIGTEPYVVVRNTVRMKRNLRQ